MIPGGLAPGKIIYINFTPTPNAQKIVVNLKEPSGDTDLHFNPRFNERAVVMNSMLRGAWGAEERAQAPFPFTPGAPTQMMILAEPNQFKIAVNGAHYTQFNLRNPNLQAIQCAEIEGDVTNATINCP
jgi:hypothetical protein